MRNEALGLARLCRRPADRGREAVLDEVDADEPLVEALAHAADRPLRIGKERAVSILERQAVDEAEAARPRLAVAPGARAVAERAREPRRRAELRGFRLQASGFRIPIRQAT